VGILTDEKLIYNRNIKNIEDVRKRLTVIFQESRDRAINDLLKLRMKVVQNGVVQPYKEKRLLDLVKSINSELADLEMKSRKVIFDGYKKTYSDTYYMESWAIEKSVNLELGLNANYLLRISTLNKNNIIAAFDKRIGGYVFKDRSLRVRNVMQYLIQDAVAQNLIEGQSVKNLAKNLNLLNDVFSGGLKQTERMARTELLKAYSIGQEAATDEAVNAGVEFTYIWSGSLDNKIRPDHAKADGQEAIIVDGSPQFTVGGIKFSSPRLPVNPTGSKKEASEVINCRCRRINAPFGIKPTSRSAKRKDGYWEKVNGDITAEEWIKKEYGVNID
jgi:hypothetical protein